MNSQSEKLFQIGCGNAIVQSQIDRSNINASISNAKDAFKYFNYSIKSNICTKEQAIERMMIYFNELKSIEHLANNYHELYKEEYCKLILQIEKSIN